MVYDIISHRIGIESMMLKFGTMLPYKFSTVSVLVRKDSIELIAFFFSPETEAKEDN